MVDNCLRIQFLYPQILLLIVIIVVADVANHPNMIREIVLLRIQFAINATRKAILKEYVDPKEKLEKCW